MSGSSQQPVNTISKASNVFPLLASTGTCTLSNIYPHRPMCMYRIKHKFLKKNLIGKGVWYTGVSRDKLLRKDHIVLRENLLVSRIFSSLTLSFLSWFLDGKDCPFLWIVAINLWIRLSGSSIQKHRANIASVLMRQSIREHTKEERPSFQMSAITQTGRWTWEVCPAPRCFKAIP